MPPEHILLIDDDTELCEELSEMLRAEGYKVTWSSQSSTGEAMIRCLDFDALILDCKMPLITGLEILERIKAESIKKKIILVSGKPFVEKELEERGLRGIVKAVLGKPMDFGLLLEKLRT
ncbi:MAG: response regulator transcription factor [Elusimicrobia bacterium]|nr:response regulator transcription factor [Elusimicrobiota bacterium]